MTPAQIARIEIIQERLRQRGARLGGLTYHGEKNSPASHATDDVIHALEAYLDGRLRIMRKLGDSQRVVHLPDGCAVTV